MHLISSPDDCTSAAELDSRRETLAPPPPNRSLRPKTLIENHAILAVKAMAPLPADRFVSPVRSRRWPYPGVPWSASVLELSREWRLT
jgi:hypothetical protein